MGLRSKVAMSQRMAMAELKVLFDGSRPAQYQPMHKQGAIILGIGGDNSNRAIGTFFEGVITYDERILVGCGRYCGL